MYQLQLKLTTYYKLAPDKLFFINLFLLIIMVVWIITVYNIL